MSKLPKEISDSIYNRYLELRGLNTYKKGHIQRILYEEFPQFGKTTLWDNSVGRFTKKLNYRNFDEFDVNDEEISKLEWKPSVKSMPTLEYKKYNSKTYLISSYEIRVGINESFLKCVENLKLLLNAEALLVPTHFKDVDYIPKRLKDIFTVIDSNIKFNENLSLEYIPTHALVQSPLSGWQGAFPGKSVILPGLIKEIVTEPSTHTCKQLITTGSVGYLNANYNDFDNHEDVEFRKRWQTTTSRVSGKATAIAQRFIKPSILVVNIIDDKIFTTRYVTMEEEGVLYDLDYKITPKGFEPSKPSALVLGDYHAYEIDKLNHKASLEMIEKFNPKEVILNDFFDGASVNHHILSDANEFSKKPSIQEEARISKKILKEISSISSRVVYLQSNHDNFIFKFLNRGIEYWRMNDNLGMCYRLQAYHMDKEKHPIIDLLQLDEIENLYFSDEKEIYHVGEVAVIHGHESFARMNFRGFTKIYNKIVTGHFHRPELFRNGACVGSNAKAEQSYSIGVSATMGANALIQPDSSIQLLPIIEGRWY